MKYQLQSIQKFKSILSVLHRYHDCFATIPVYEACFRHISTNTDRMSLLINSLTVPVKSVGHQRIAGRRQLLDEFGRFLQFCFIIADVSEKCTLHSFVRDYRSVSAHQLIIYAKYLLQIIGQHPPEAAVSIGLTAHETQQLQGAIQQYETAIIQVGYSFDQRKRDRQKIQELIAENHQMLQNTFDRYIKAMQTPTKISIMIIALRDSNNPPKKN